MTESMSIILVTLVGIIVMVAIALTFIKIMLDTTKNNNKEL